MREGLFQLGEVSKRLVGSLYGVYIVASKVEMVGCGDCLCALVHDLV